MCRKILCMCAALACARGWAQDVPTLREVVVTATRVEAGVLDSPSSVSVISAQQIADSGATDVAEVINGQPGVVVNDYGPTGALKTVSLRGSTSSQVLVLLDGIRLNSSVNGEVDLSSIPMEIIDHIEIVRGGESSLYGSSAIGGVINIITKKAEKPSVSLNITNGSYIPHAANTVSSTLTPTPVAANPMDLLDSQNVDLSMTGKLGDLGLNGGGSFTRAANGFTWDDTTLPINAWRRRTNADSLSGSGYAGINAPVLGGDLSAKGIFHAANTGTPGSLTVVSESARQTDTSASGSFSWKTDRFFTDALTLDLKGLYRYDELGDNDPDYPPASLHRTQSAVGDLTQKLTFSDAISAVYGGNVSYDYVNSTNYPGPKDRLNVAGFLSVPVSPIEWLTITPSARYDYFTDFDGSFSYSLSAVVLLSEQSSLRASFASGYRVPALNDLYWGYQFFSSSYQGVTYDSIVVANASLKPETSYSGEVGWSLDLKKLSFDASVFTRLVHNNIIWVTTDNYEASTSTDTTTTEPENLYETLFPGAEIHGKLMITDTVSLEVSYTFLYSLLLNDGTTALSLADDRRVPYAPLHTVAAEVRYAGTMHSGGVTLRYVSDQYTDSANTPSSVLPGFVVVDIDYRFKATENMAFTLTAKNIFDTLYYTQLDYPMPPFSIQAGVSLTL